jgi:hypothetical protein
MPNLKPFRDFSQHDVINLFSYDGTATAGTLVKIDTNWKDIYGEGLSLSNLSNIGNTMSSSFTPVGKVSKTTAYTDTPIGILLKNVIEYDENGTPLIYEPQLLAERDAVLPQQAAPILTKGIVLINDIDVTDNTAGAGGGGYPTIGAAAYVGTNGRVATDGIVRIGTFLSEATEENSNGYCLLRLNIQ